MIIAKVYSNWFNSLALDVKHEESCKISCIDDVLDKIQDIYSYIFARCDKEIRFLIEDNWIESRVDGNNVFIYFHNKSNMFEMLCASYEIVIDDETIYLHCYQRDRKVVRIKLM